MVWAKEAGACRIVTGRHSTGCPSPTTGGMAVRTAARLGEMVVTSGRAASEKIISRVTTTDRADRAGNS